MSVTTMRTYAGRLIELLDEVGDDVLAAEKELTAVLADILAMPGLDTVNATPAAIGVDDATATTGWLYNDGDLRIVRGRMPAGLDLAPHNHGAWNLFGVYDGALQYTSYRRRDDGQVPFVADLEVAEKRVMTHGDVTVLPGPPHDIHAVLGLAPMTTTILVARGAFAEVRERYHPDRGCYERSEGAAAGTLPAL